MIKPYKNKANVTQNVEPSFDSLLDSFLPGNTPTRGGLVNGTVVARCRNGFWVDFGAKSEGLAPFDKPGNDSLKIGNTHWFEVVGAADEENLVLSAEAGFSWNELSSIQRAKRTAQVLVTRIQRKAGKVSGASVRYDERINGFIPFSLLGTTAREADFLKDQTIEVQVEALSFETGKVVFNRRTILDEQKLAYEARRAQVIASIPAGTMLKQIPITGIACNKDATEYGLFVDVNGVRGLVYKSEIPRATGMAISAVHKIGDLIDVVVLPARESEGRSELSLSIRAAKQVKRNEFFKDHKIGEVFTGTVVRKVDYGVFVCISEESTVDGLLHQSQFPLDGAPALASKISVRIITLDPKAKIIGLALARSSDVL